MCQNICMGINRRKKNCWKVFSKIFTLCSTLNFAVPFLYLELLFLNFLDIIQNLFLPATFIFFFTFLCSFFSFEMIVAYCNSPIIHPVQTISQSHCYLLLFLAAGMHSFRTIEFWTIVEEWKRNITLNYLLLNDLWVLTRPIVYLIWRKCV